MQETITIADSLAYFRKAIAEPMSVPPWSEWWAKHAEGVEQIFPLVDFVRLKHRRLFGARQILQRAGEIPKDYTPSSPLRTGACGQCGERVALPATIVDGSLTCPHCGHVYPNAAERTSP